MCTNTQNHVHTVCRIYKNHFQYLLEIKNQVILDGIQITVHGLICSITILFNLSAVCKRNQCQSPEIDLL